MRGFKPQRSYLQHAIDELKPDVISIQETHLKEKDHAFLAGYNPPWRKDREEIEKTASKKKTIRRR